MQSKTKSSQYTSAKNYIIDDLQLLLTANYELLHTMKKAEAQKWQNSPDIFENKHRVVEHQTFITDILTDLLYK